MTADHEPPRRSPSRRLGTGWGVGVPFAEGGTGRILIAGDLHMDLPHTRSVITAAANRGVTTILQLGDSQLLWPGTQGAKYTRGVESALSEAGVSLCVLDGNHDNHPALRAIPVGPSGFARVSEHIWHVPRGAIWEWHGRTFGALGGAYSVDRGRRREGFTLWADLEEVTAADVAKLDAPVDILLTHDAPTGVNLAGLVLSDTDRRRSDAQRELVRAAVDATKPRVLCHGHWHVRRSGLLARDDGAETMVHSLAANDAGLANFVVLNLADLSIEDPREQ